MSFPFEEHTSGYSDTGELAQNAINHLTAAEVFPFVGLVSCWLYTPQANCGYQLRYVIIRPLLLSRADKKNICCCHSRMVYRGRYRERMKYLWCIVVLSCQQKLQIHFHAAKCLTPCG